LHRGGFGKKVETGGGEDRIRIKGVGGAQAEVEQMGRSGEHVVKKSMDAAKR